MTNVYPIHADIFRAAYRQDTVNMTADGRTSTGHIIGMTRDTVTMLEHDTDLRRTAEYLRVTKWVL